MSGFFPFIVAALVAANLWMWFLVINRWRRGRALVALEPRRSAPWTGWDLAFIALGTLVANAVVLRLLSGDHVLGASGETDAAIAPSQMPALLMSAATVNLVVLVAAVAWIRYRRRADWTDLGLDLRRLPADVLVGLIAFAVVSVPIYAMQAGLTQLTPSEHPIVKAWQELEPGWELRLSSLFSVVLVAPLTEEFLFRVLLQGWLESLGRFKSLEGGASIQRNDQPMTGAAIQPACTRRRWVPIVLSSLIFALMHLAHGPDVVPLFFFALALGYLYQQTHRLWAPMVVHLCLNACTLAMLWIGP
jgi:membrane protease YdiL (CAAX protease family)